MFQIRRYFILKHSLSTNCGYTVLFVLGIFIYILLNTVHLQHETMKYTVYMTKKIRVALCTCNYVLEYGMKCADHYIDCAFYWLNVQHLWRQLSAAETHQNVRATCRYIHVHLSSIHVHVLCKSYDTRCVMTSHTGQCYTTSEA